MDWCLVSFVFRTDGIVHSSAFGASSASQAEWLALYIFFFFGSILQ